MASSVCHNPSGTDRHSGAHHLYERGNPLGLGISLSNHGTPLYEGVTQITVGQAPTGACFILIVV